MKHLFSIVSTLIVASALTLAACGKDKKPAASDPAKPEPAAATEPAATEPAAAEPTAAEPKPAPQPASGGGW